MDTGAAGGNVIQFKKGQRVRFEDYASVRTRTGTRELRGVEGTVLGFRPHDGGNAWYGVVYWVPDDEGLRPSGKVGMGMGHDDWSSNAGQLRVVADGPAEYAVDWGQAWAWGYS